MKNGIKLSRKTHIHLASKDHPRLQNVSKYPVRIHVDAKQMYKNNYHIYGGSENTYTTPYEIDLKFNICVVRRLLLHTKV